MFEVWILVIIVSMSGAIDIETITGFDSKERCETARRDITAMGRNTMVNIRSVCLSK